MAGFEPTYRGVARRPDYEFDQQTEEPDHSHDNDRILMISVILVVVGTAVIWIARKMGPVTYERPLVVTNPNPSADDSNLKNIINTLTIVTKPAE